MEAREPNKSNKRDGDHHQQDHAPLAEHIAYIPEANNPQKAKTLLDDARLLYQSKRADKSDDGLQDGVNQEKYKQEKYKDELEELFDKNKNLEPFLLGVIDNSPFLCDLICRDLDRLICVLKADPSRHIAELITALKREVSGLDSEAEVMAILRCFKQDAALTIALADIAGLFSLSDVMACLTDIADAALRAAVSFLILQEAHRGTLKPSDPTEPEQGCGYSVLAMGKYGAHELNFSSDIDLIVFYDPEKAPLSDPLDGAKIFVRMTKGLVRLMQERTADGYVFRTDLRLRPDPGATAIAMNVNAALQYYESLGQNWERAALIKARPAAGDLQVGAMILKEIEPFIWRKYLDYAAIADIHSIKRQIHAHKGHDVIAVAGHDIKLGRGGIREIEFFVQTQQLIAGGRNVSLRGKQTLAMLEELAELGWIDEITRDDMYDAYCFFRTIEHRIQMIADEQTHKLPMTEEGLLQVAHLAGFTTLDRFNEALITRLESVHHHYSALFETEQNLTSNLGNLVFTGDTDDPTTLETLSSLGYQRPKDIISAVRAWHFGRYPATRAIKSRERLTELVPTLIEAFTHTDNPDRGFVTFDRMIRKLPAGIQLFSILKSNPRLLDLIAIIMGTAPRLAEIIALRPHVLAALLDPAFFDAIPTYEEMNDLIVTTFGEASSYEDVLDRARIFGQEHNFLIAVRLLTDTITAEQAGYAYTQLAAAITAHLLENCQNALSEAHGKVKDTRIALLALGKFGGEEMTATSDLDLILIYDHDPDIVQSDGERPIAPATYFTRLTQRLIAALSAPTAEGTLYEVDLRLRPSGKSGPLATHIDAFRHYQVENAWTWEHMALTRARVIAGDISLAKEVDVTIQQTLCKARDQPQLQQAVADMRARMEAEKKSDDIWNIKHVPGGLIDIEFIAQYMQLAHAESHPDILNTNTARVLEAVAGRDFLPKSEVEILLIAIRLYHDLTQLIRLSIEGDFDRGTAAHSLTALLAHANDMPDGSTLEAHLGATETMVREIFNRLLESSIPLEQ